MSLDGRMPSHDDYKKERSSSFYLVCLRSIENTKLSSPLTSVGLACDWAGTEHELGPGTREVAAAGGKDFGLMMWPNTYLD